MAGSFFFYDLETSGFNPKEARIMQFAGQRTDLSLRPIGQPVNVLVKMSEDILPDPQAVLVTGITPQATIIDGLSEAEFLKLFHIQVVTPGTIFVGYNIVRFDDEFMRYLHYRNFYDPYEWQWQENRSRWDLLDVVRMTRAIRPDNIKWPVDANGKPTNRLELLSALNQLDHTNAHEALSDVRATIALAHLIKKAHPKLFDFLLKVRAKQPIADLTGGHQPFVYTSGKYASEYEKTAVVAKLADHPTRHAIFVYDLRYDPLVFRSATPEQLAKAWQYHEEKDQAPITRLPVKTLQFNRCPAVAPLSVLDTASQKRLQLNLADIEANFKKLNSMTDFPERLLKAQAILDKKQQAKYLAQPLLVDAQLYNGFFDASDKTQMNLVHSASADELRTLSPKFRDQRLTDLLPLYKARNFPSTLTEEEHRVWEQFRINKLLENAYPNRVQEFMVHLADITTAGNLTAHQEYLIEELRLWSESILPATNVE